MIDDICHTLHFGRKYGRVSKGLIFLSEPQKVISLFLQILTYPSIFQLISDRKLCHFIRDYIFTVTYEFINAV
jgi:hypothetical protein